MPDSPAPARTGVVGVVGVALGPWAVSALALLAAWAAGGAADDGSYPDTNVGVALSQAINGLLATAVAGALVWCAGAAVLVRICYRPEQQRAAWGLLVLPAGVTALIGLAVLAYGITALPALWVGQQVVLSVVAVRLHRSWGRTA
jgi:hypothetical protein